MRIALITGDGRTAGEVGEYCSFALRKLGHTVHQWMHAPDRGMRFFPKALKLLPRLGHNTGLRLWLHWVRPELVIVIKGQDLGPDQVRGLRRVTGVPWVNWWMDDPQLLDLSITLSPAYDLFLTDDPPSVESHRRAGAKADWLTFGHDPRFHQPRSAPKTPIPKHYDCDVVFAGRLTPRRVEHLTPLIGLGLSLWTEPEIHSVGDLGEVLVTALPSGHPLRGVLRGGFVWGEEFTALYSASKIGVHVLAHDVYRGTNMRVFEATACGTLLIVEDTPLVPRMFQVGGPAAEVIVFSGVRDLQEKVRYYLLHEDERASIAARGMERCRRDHTYEERMKSLLNLAHDH